MTILEAFQLAKYAPWSSHQQPCSIAAESDPDIIRRRYTYLSSSRLWSLRRPGIKAIENPLPSGSCSGYSSDGQYQKGVLLPSSQTTDLLDATAGEGVPKPTVCRTAGRSARQENRPSRPEKDEYDPRRRSS